MHIGPISALYRLYVSIGDSSISALFIASVTGRYRLYVAQAHALGTVLWRAVERGAQVLAALRSNGTIGPLELQGFRAQPRHGTARHGTAGGCAATAWMQQGSLRV